VNPARKQDQADLDKQLVAVVKSTPLLDRYLKTKFTLRHGQAPHALKF